jgi:RimJ/RimL family protein N-acetyltransferase
MDLVQSDPAPSPEARRGFVIARGRRVSLRTLIPDDLDLLSKWADDPFLEEMVGSELLHLYKDVYDRSPAFYEACVSDPTQVVLVVDVNADPRAGIDGRPDRWPEPVGLVRLFNIHLLEGYAFLETIIGDRRAIKRGFGIEAARLICSYGVDVLGLRRYEAKVYEYNVLSMNSLRRNGFRQEGVLRAAGLQGGRFWDVVVFGLVGEDLEHQRSISQVTYPLEP